jgi:hypothetical protein
MPTTRRMFIAAAAGVLATPRSAFAEQALAPAADLAGRVAGFLAKLKAASFPWDGPQWKRWDYFGVSGYSKPGLRLEDMDAASKDRAWEIFASLLSPEGLTKARNVMLLQDVLMEEGDGVGQRSRERFSLSVHGTPGVNGAWGLRLEGHHLSLSFAVRDGALVSVTPAAFAVRPARVMRGRHKGLVTIRDEEMLARQLFQGLTPALQKRARVRDNKLFNILSTAGQERANAAKVGLAAAEMTTSQVDLLWNLIEAYAVRPYTGAAAERQKARIRSGDPSAVHFAWYGPNVAEQSFGYRIISDAFVIELGCIDSEAQHLHPIYHDLGNVLGLKA